MSIKIKMKKYIKHNKNNNLQFICTYKKKI